MRQRSKDSSPRSRTGGPFVSRELEIAQLQHAMKGALGGQGQIVLVVGEPGIGKTSLAQRLATLASRRGAHVLWGRASDSGASPPYWLWAQVVRAFAADAASQRRREAQDLVQQLMLSAPILSTAHPGFPQPRSLPAEDSVRFRVAEAVGLFLDRACRRSAMVLLLDDLHHADRNSLFVLESVAQGVMARRLLVLSTCREGGLAPYVQETVAELARLGCMRLALGGLDLKGTARLIAAATRRRPTEDVVRAVHARTGGNPFFVTEVARFDAPAALAIPQNVRAVIWKQLARVSSLAGEVLAVASVMGREFQFPLLVAAIPDMTESQLLRAIDEGLQAFIIEPGGSSDGEEYQFRHPLIREAIYSSLSPSRRARWHATIAVTLAGCAGGMLDSRAAEIAQHGMRAGVRVPPALVVRWASVAGEQLLAAHAFDDALPYLERAWHFRGAAPLDARGAAVLSGLGCAQAATSVRWNRQRGWLTVRPAIEYYLETDDIGRATGLATHPCFTNEGTRDVAGLVERIRQHAPRGSVDEGWLLARAGAAIYFERGDYAAAYAAFSRAIGIAAAERAPGLELRTLAYATSVDHFELRWPDVLARSRRVRELARRVNDLHSETYARYRAAYAFMQTGRAEDATIEAHDTVGAAERLKDHGLLADALYVTSLLAQMKGDWHEARRHSDRGLLLAPGQLPLLHARVLLEYETGHRTTSDRYLRRLQAADDVDCPYPLAGAFVALAAAQTAQLAAGPTAAGDPLQETRALVARRAPIPNALATARVTKALIALRQSRRVECEEALEFLSPFNSMILAPCLVTDRLLGRLARRAGQRRRAIAHFEDALAFCRRSGYLPELAWTCFEYAGTLLEGTARVDRMQAAALLEEAFQLATQLGLRPLASASLGLKRRHELRLQRKPAGLTCRELEILQLLSVGRTNKKIADLLGVSTNTVAVHVARVLQKTGASNRTEAAAYALRRNLFGTTAD